MENICRHYLGIFTFISVTILVLLVTINWHWRKQLEKNEQAIAYLHQKTAQLFTQIDTSKIKASEQVQLINQIHYENKKESDRIQLESKKIELFWHNVSFIGIGSILGFVYLLLILPKQIQAKAELAIDESIAKIINGRSRDFQKLINKYNKEDQLINECKIAIYQVNGETPVNHILDDLGLRYFTYEDAVREKKPFNIFLINNLSGKSYKEGKNEDVLPILDELPTSTYIFYYSEERGNNLSIDTTQYPKLQGRYNFANAQATFLGNLLDLLKLQNRKNH